MRISVPAAALALGGSLALGAFVAPAAQATPAAPVVPPGQSCQSLGVANLYGEFVEGDDTHAPDAEGAVAVGGNADFSAGFSIGQELTADQVKALPGGNALVVGGDIKVGGGNTEVMHGNGVYAGRKIGDGRLESHDGTVVHGASPIDFATEFAALRKVSAALAAQGATAGTAVTASGSGGGATLTLTGTDATYDNFVVTAAQLQGAKAIQLKVPAGAVAVVNVTGDSYDSKAAGTTSVWLWDHTAQTYVLDDKSRSADGGAVRAALLWNFPTATTVVKNSQLAWAGSVLAPDAAFDLGTGAPVNGSVIVKSLTGSGGAETHHYPFTGCLPVTPPVVVPPTPTPTNSAPSPTSSPTTTTSSSSPTTKPSTPATGTPRPAGTPTPGATASAPAVPAGPTTPAPSTPAPATHGGLAFTGAAAVIPLSVGGALVLAAGAGIVVATRRRSARRV
ncbi:choice-of-anchor A family protein [Kitasatospora mediocidica]|uniref:choice-of-anchor A family protein n=1 Tax=Kitasatospora mediocidica TaxID=58352 RepID=UPI00056145C0|nr:choice-of-anchor A family protein [Kitasatospora mediocidica]